MLSRRWPESSVRLAAPLLLLPSPCNILSSEAAGLTQGKNRTSFPKEISVQWYCIWETLAFQLGGVFVTSTSILNLKVSSVMRMSDSMIFLHKTKRNKKVMYSRLLICFWGFLNLVRGIGISSGRYLSMNFKHMSNTSSCILCFFHLRFSFFLGMCWEGGSQGRSGFLEVLFFTCNRWFPGNGHSLGKVSFNSKQLLAESLQLDLGVMPAVTTESCACYQTQAQEFSPWQAPQSVLKIKEHLSSSWGWAGRELERDICVCWGLGALFLSLFQ